MTRRTLAGRYELRRRLGDGGMGTVWEGRDVVLERGVAVKLLTGAGAGDRSFLREVRALSRLQHPHVVRLFDAGTDGGDAYLVLELVRGWTLAETMAERPLDTAAVRRLGRELAEALDHAHALGVVHRDLSPGNVLMETDGRARLSDFGVARLAESTATLGGQRWGTPAYLAPEQVAGEPVGPPADIYALGLVLLEAWSGRRAFPGTPTETSLARLHRAPDLPAGMPADLRALVTEMTRRDPADRPGAAEVAQRLGSVRPPAGPPAPSPLSPATTMPLGRPPIPRVGRVRVLAAALLAAAALLGLALWPEPGRQPGPATTVRTDAPAAPVSPAPPPAPTPTQHPEAHDDEDDDDEHNEDDDGRRGKGRGKGRERGRGED